MERVGHRLRQLLRQRTAVSSYRKWSEPVRRTLYHASKKGAVSSALPGVCQPSKFTTSAFVPLRSSAPQTLPQIPEAYKPQLIIFDKNGTLFSFHTAWTPWIQALARRLQDSTAHQLEQKVYDVLDFCSLTQKTRSGVLAEGTTFQIKRVLEDMLVEEGCDRRMAQLIVEDNWEDCEISDPDQLESLANLSELFHSLKKQNVKIAVCTSDTRFVTERTFSQFGLDKYIDMLVCGDDITSLPKPLGHNAKEICKALNVSPGQTMVIGDTQADLKMGHNADLGAMIGVLSGVGSRLDLYPYADHIIPDISKLLPLLARKNVFSEGADRVTADQDTESSMRPGKKAGLVIFDKDGTLLCFHSMWTPWAEKLIARLEKITGMKHLRVRILSELGFCHDTSTWGMGLLAEKPTAMNKACIHGILMDKGLSEKEATAALDEAWVEGDHTSDNKDLKVLDDPHVLFKVLKEYGVKIAVCTADAREPTKQFLKEQNLGEYVDMIVCGDDPENVPKPAPHNAWRICKTLNVDPFNAIIVGDTIADVGMGHAAQLGASIGVLTGVGRTKDLESMSDYVVPSIKHILPIVLPDCHKDLMPPETLAQKHAGDTAVKQPGKMNVSPILKRQLTATGSSSGARPFSSCAWQYSYHQRNQIRNYQTQANNDKNTYTHIIVGAGSAGCVLANRLSSNPTNRVLLLEAGPRDSTWKIHMPAALMYNLCDDLYNWYYHTEPQKHMNFRTMYWPRGRVWGGSSSLNAMVYIRGHAYDYDRWEKEGATGWSYADCLPYFRKSETHSLSGDEYRGSSGLLEVYRAKADNPLHEAFIEAGQQAGYPFTEDMNGYQQEGVGYMDMTIHNGHRCNAARAFLYPVLYRDNIQVNSDVMATKVLFDRTRAVGVEYMEGNQLVKAFADCEVILSGGAINSPQLLMLSGVGNADDLRRLDIPVVANLPGVGQNLQDHLEVYVQQQCTKPVTLYKYQWKFPFNMVSTGLEWFLSSTGNGASTHLETGGFVRTEPGVEHPNLQFHFLPSTVHDHGRKMGHCHAYQVHVGPMRSTSTGYLRLRSKDPKDHPIIDPNYMSSKHDRKEMRDCIKIARDIFQQKAFDEFRGPELQPGLDVNSDAEIDAFVRAHGDSAYHPSCTCKMGQEDDGMAVVDPQCSVIGVQGLRVVDASIMPSVVSGNLNGPTIMVAEKAADIILGLPPLPKSTAPVWKPPSLTSTKPLFDTAQARV